MNYGSKRIAKPMPWTPEQIALLESLRGQGVDWEDIGRQCGHTGASCCTTLSALKRKRREASGEKQPRGVNRRPYTDTDVKILIQMRNVEKRSFPEIDVALNRPEGSACAKYHTLRLPGVAVPAIEPKQAAPQVNLSHKTLTAELCGDPLPGRSALDRKRMAEGVSA
jgi:hypothetical protein